MMCDPRHMTANESVTTNDPTAPLACDGVGLARPLTRTTAEEIARLLKAVGDSTRLQLLSIIRSAPNGEACVCDLTDPIGLSQPTISHHLKIMTEAGILTRDQRGIWAWYSINQDRLIEIAQIFQ